MNDFYTFIVTSTINASSELFDTTNRYAETLQTLSSIKSKVENVKIIFIDNSVSPLSKEQTDTIDSMSDISIYLTPNLFFDFSNSVGLKSVGEAYMIYEVMKLMKKENLIGKRIFKICGRYKLSDTFDISMYNDTFNGKYAFRKVIQGNATSFKGYETTMFSFCSTLFDNYFNLIPVMFADMMLNVTNLSVLWEVSNYNHLPTDCVTVLTALHIEGYSAGLCKQITDRYVGPNPIGLSYVKK